MNPLSTPNYTDLHAVVINGKKYSVHRHVLELSHYFKTILSGKFNDTDIVLDFDGCCVEINHIIDIMYRYYTFIDTIKHTPFSNINTLTFIPNGYKKFTFNEFMHMICIFDFLQFNTEIEFKDTIILTDLLFNSFSNIETTFVDILNANIGDKYKKMFLNRYIKSYNIIPLKFVFGNNSIRIIETIPKVANNTLYDCFVTNNEVKCNNIKIFFNAFSTDIKSYKLSVSPYNGPLKILGLTRAGEPIRRNFDYELYIDDILIETKGFGNQLDLIDALTPILINKLIDNPNMEHKYIFDNVPGIENIRLKIAVGY